MSKNIIAKDVHTKDIKYKFDTFVRKSKVRGEIWKRRDTKELYLVV